HHLAEIVIGFAIFVAVILVDGVHSLVEIPFVQIARGDDLAIFLSHQTFRVAWSHHAPAQHAHRDAAGWGGVSGAPEGASRNEHWRGYSRAGGEKKTTTSDLRVN